MRARFPGKCLGAGDRVRVGDELVRDRYGWSHPAHKGFAKTYDAPRGYVEDPGNAAEAEMVRQERARDLDFAEALSAERERRRDDAEYAAGLADGRRYQAERDVFGSALAEKFRAMDEFNSYWKNGEDY